MGKFDEVGGEGDLEQQQERVLKEWGANKLLEDYSKKEVSMEDIEASAAQQVGARDLLTSDGIELKSELNPKEIVALTRILFVAERHDIKGIDVFANRLLELKVSLSRKGRREFIDGLHAEERRERGGDLSPLAAALSKVGL